MTRLAIAIDKHRCIGCNTCALACKMQNNVPDGMLWNRVLTEDCDIFDGAVGQYPNLSRSYLPIACQHCENAACLRACPTGATYLDDKGRVEIDYDKCIGCRMCMAACPYNARAFNWNEPSRSMCVHCCPADARIFGDLDDPDSEIFKLRREQTAHVLMEDMGTRPQVFYVN